MVSSLLNWIRQSNSFWGRALLGILGGLAIAISFPAFNIWPAIFLGIFLILLAIRQLGFFKAFFVGTFAGFAFYGLVLKWLTTYLGPLPWFLLSFVEALMFGLAFGVMAVVWRWLSSLKLGRFEPFVVAFVLGAIYTAREYVAGRFPFDGLPWARAGLSQADTWISKLVWAVDIAGLSWLIAFLSALAAIQFVKPLPAGSGIRLRFRSWLPTATAWLVVLGIPALMVIPTDGNAGTMKIAAVQGNANAGLFAINPPGSIMDKHLDVARELVKSGSGQGLDLMVWPENSSDLDPVTMLEPNMKISKFVDEELNAPLLFGNKTFRGKDFYNEVDLWAPDKGLVDWYDKKRPVPFGEYVPYRSFFMSLAPEMIGLIGWDMSAGTRDGLFDIPNKGKVGSLICFEVTIDYLSYDLVNGGAQAIMVQTNSSDFGKSEQGVQLAAISRMRAIETGRTVVSISTVGVSGIYAPDGSVMHELETFKPGAMVSEIALRDDITPAVRFGRYFEEASFFLAIAMFSIAVVGLTVSKRRKKTS